MAGSDGIVRMENVMVCVVGILIAKGQSNDRSALAWKVVILIAVAFLWWFHALVVALQIDLLQM